MNKSGSIEEYEDQMDDYFTLTYMLNSFLYIMTFLVYSYALLQPVLELGHIIRTGDTYYNYDYKLILLVLVFYSLILITIYFIFPKLRKNFKNRIKEFFSFKAIIRILMYLITYMLLLQLVEFTIYNISNFLLYGFFIYEEFIFLDYVTSSLILFDSAIFIYFTALSIYNYIEKGD